LLYNGPLLRGFNVMIKGYKQLVLWPTLYTNSEKTKPVNSH